MWYCQCNIEFFLLSNCVLLRCSIRQDKTAGTDTAPKYIYLKVHYINAPDSHSRRIRYILSSSKEEIYFFDLNPITACIKHQSYLV